MHVSWAEVTLFHPELCLQIFNIYTKAKIEFNSLLCFSFAGIINLHSQVPQPISQWIKILNGQSKVIYSSGFIE